MLFLIYLFKSKINWNIILSIPIFLIIMSSSKLSVSENLYLSTDNKSFNNLSGNISCDKLRSRCDKLYSQLSTMEEDCRTYRIYLGCLQILRSSNSLCQVNLHFLLLLSTTEKLIKEKCSSGDITPIEPPRDLIFSNSVSQRNPEEEKMSSLSPCLESIQGSDRLRNEYYLCSLFGHPNLLLFSGERQTCRLQGAWPLINNRFLTVQITGEKSNLLHFHDPTSSTITQISILIKPDGKCINDFGIPKLIYVALSDSSLPMVLLNGRKEIPQSLISIKSILRTKFQEKVELWLGHINTRIIIVRTEIADGEFTLSIIISLPLRVSTAQPRSRQQNLVRELCSEGCPPSESIDDRTLLRNIYLKLNNSISRMQKSSREKSQICLKNDFKGLFFDICYLMSEILSSTNLIVSQSPETLKSLENYIVTSIYAIQKNIFQFSHIVSVNFSFDLSSRIQFIPFRPLWKIRSLENKSKDIRKSSCRVVENGFLKLAALLFLLIIPIL